MKKIKSRKKMNLNKEMVSKLNEDQLYTLKGGGELPTREVSVIDDEDDILMETGYAPCAENATKLCYVKK